MGIDFSAVLDVTIDWPDLLKIPAQLDLLTEELSALWADDLPRGDPQRWLLELRSEGWFCSWPEDYNEEAECRLQPGLMGPWWFHIVPYTHVAELSHVCRWKLFLQDLNQRERLRKSCKLIAKKLGAKQIAYIPDLGFEEIEERGLHRGPFGRIVSHLHKTWGDPSRFGQTYPLGHKYWERYFVEPV